LLLRIAAQWQNPIFPASKHVFFSWKSPLRIGCPNASTEVFTLPVKEKIRAVAAKYLFSA